MWILEVFQACPKKVRILSCSLPVLLLTRLLFLDHEVREVLKNSTLLTVKKKKNTGKQFLLDYVYTYNIFKLRRGKRLDLQPTFSSSATSTTSKPVRKLLLAHQRCHLGRNFKRDQIGSPIKPDRPLQRCLCPPQLPCLSQTLPRTWVLDNLSNFLLVYVIYKFVSSITSKIPTMHPYSHPTIPPKSLSQLGRSRIAWLGGVE